MQEIIDQGLEYARGMWRFRRIALIVTWIVALLGWMFVFSMRDVYEASSRVFVDPKTALKPVLQGLTLDQDVNAQLSLVQQSLLAGPQLQLVAQEAGLLDVRTTSPEQRSQIVNALRKRVTLNVSVATNNRGGPPDRDAGTIYAIKYRDTSRERSLHVVEILQNNLIEDTLGGKREGSENAQKFLGSQISEYEQRLRIAEDRLAEFKKVNVGLMPDEQGGYFNRLQKEMEAVKSTESLLSVAISRREELQRQLRGEAPLAALSGTLGAPGTIGASPGDTSSRIKETQARLDELLLRFTAKHPDVVAAQETLEQLEKRRIAEIEALRRGDPNAAIASGAAANPVYQSIQLQLNQVDVEVASLRRQLAGHQSSVAELRKMLDTMPQVEAEYARLNRDYDVTKANYTALVERLEKSRLGDQATTSGSVRFDVIDPPFAPFSPSSPSRSLMVMAVILVALAAGGGAAFLMHMLRPVFTSARALAEATGLRVLGTVSMTWLERHQREERKAYWWYSAAAISLLVVGLVVLQLSRMGVRLGPIGGA